MTFLDRVASCKEGSVRCLEPYIKDTSLMGFTSEDVTLVHALKVQKLLSYYVDGSSINEQDLLYVEETIRAVSALRSIGRWIATSNRGITVYGNAFIDRMIGSADELFIYITRHENHRYMIQTQRRLGSLCSFLRDQETIYPCCFDLLSLALDTLNAHTRQEESYEYAHEKKQEFALLAREYSQKIRTYGRLSV